MSLPRGGAELIDQMNRHPATAIEMFASLWRHRELIRAASSREVLGRYRGSTLGLAWSFFNPLLMLAVYTFVFGEIFKARWGGEGESKTQFALILFSGMIVFNVFADCLARSPLLVIGNANYVKKVVFPLEILPYISVASSLFHALVSLVVWFLGYALLFGRPHLEALWVLVIFLPYSLLVLGASWLLASLGTYVRDIPQFTSLLTTVLMFLSPVFYPSNSLPAPYRKLLYVNPLTFVIEQCRQVLIGGVGPDLPALAIFTAFAFMCAWAGFAWFQITRKGFADVL